MKIRCTTCGVPCETEDGFETAYCLTCGSPITVKDALDYRFSPETLESLETESLVQLAKEAYHTHKITPEVLTLLKAASPSGDVEILYVLGLNHFNNKAYSQAIPYLYIAAEKMYPDAQCLYAVCKYMQSPEDHTIYPRIRKYLTNAKETCSKVYDKIDGDKLLTYINSVLDSKEQTGSAPAAPSLEKVSTVN